MYSRCSNSTFVCFMETLQFYHSSNSNFVVSLFYGCYIIFCLFFHNSDFDTNKTAIGTHTFLLLFRSSIISPFLRARPFLPCHESSPASAPMPFAHFLSTPHPNLLPQPSPEQAPPSALRTPSEPLPAALTAYTAEQNHLDRRN